MGSNLSLRVKGQGRQVRKCKNRFRACLRKLYRFTSNQYHVQSFYTYCPVHFTSENAQFFSTFVCFLKIVCL